jgi:hypothetical protein
MLTGQRADEIASLRWPEITETTVPEERITDTIRLPQFNIGAIDLPAERTIAGIVARIEPSNPTPRCRRCRLTRTQRDRADMDIAVIDAPGLLMGVRIAAAGQSGRARMMPWM